MEPFDPFIPRQIEDKELEKILNAFSWGLDKVVDFGSNLVKWDVETARGQDDNLPITLSLRHFIELIDGTSILIKKASVDPSKLLLRGALETYFGLEYIFEKDTKQRCMSFLVWHAHKKLKTYQRLDNSTQQGKQLEQAIKKDDLLSDFSLPTIPKLAAAIDNLESLLKLPLYQQAEVEYQRLVGQGEKNPAWYRLFNGSNSIDELARRLWRQQKVCTIAGLGVLITFGFHYLHLARGTGRRHHCRNTNVGSNAARQFFPTKKVDRNE